MINTSIYIYISLILGEYIYICAQESVKRHEENIDRAKKQSTKVPKGRICVKCIFRCMHEREKRYTIFISTN